VIDTRKIKEGFDRARPALETFLKVTKVVISAFAVVGSIKELSKSITDLRREKRVIYRLDVSHLDPDDILKAMDSVKREMKGSREI
jgi:hypothetical protein